MPALIRSIALIRHPERGEEVWLSAWNANRMLFELPCAEPLEGESFRECLEREIAWVLPLRRGKDYIVSSVPRLHHVAKLALSCDGDEADVAVEFFVVDLYGRVGVKSLADHPPARWLTAGELRAGATDDGRPIDPLLVQLIRQSDVIAAHG